MNYQMMTSKRISGMIRKLWFLAILACLAPACDKMLPAPFPIDGRPSIGATVAHNPLMVVQWDQPMDATSVTTPPNIAIYENSPLALYPSNLYYFPGTNQSLIINTAPLPSPTGASSNPQLIIGGSPSVKSVAGGFLDSSGITILNSFSVTASSDPTVVNLNPPVFSISASAAQPGAASGTIDITFTLATQTTGSPGVTATMNGFYDVYMATTAGGENLISAATIPNLGSASVATSPTTGKITVGPTGPTLTSGTTYYFIIIARDTFGNVGVATTETSAMPLP